MSERVRLFVAVGLPATLREELRQATAVWRDAVPGLRWTDPAAMHLTLAFIGDVGVDRLPELSDTMSRVASAHRPMRLATGGLGAFPQPATARVLWYGIHDPDDLLRALADDLRRSLGADGNGPFQAHVTLARARHGALDLRPLVARLDPLDGRLDVDGVELIRSHLGPGTPRYRLLARASLEVPAHV